MLNEQLNEHKEETATHKVRLIKKDKRRKFQQTVQKTSEKRDEIWALTWWAHMKAHKFSELLKMSDLQCNENIAQTLNEKTWMLYTRFYSEVKADLSDIANMSFSEDSFKKHWMISDAVTEKEVTVILCLRKLFKASKVNSILNEFLYVMSSSLTRAVTTLITACWHLKMFSQFFKTAHTVMLRKLDKASYKDSETWRSIALLNTLRKLMKELMTKQLLKTAKKHKLIAETQMRACTEHFTKWALCSIQELQTEVKCHELNPY